MSRSAEVAGYSTCSRNESSWSRPDSAKGIDSGYVPLAAMIFGEKIADWVRDKYFASGLNSPSPTSSSRSCEHASTCQVGRRGANDQAVD
jgi:adenosylmethionine-8-amino-7-oxononanoate aminotransferase